VLSPNASHTPRKELDRIPAAAIDSFAGVGHFLDLATIAPGETVLDLESGSGMDSFLAARAAGPDGHTIGVDMTDEQLAKATRLAREGRDRQRRVPGGLH
jgi:arsenite methyltransferase